MSTLAIQLHENLHALYLYSKKSKKIVKTVLLKNGSLECCLSSIRRMMRLEKIETFAVVYGMRRFSLVRQATLVGNMLALVFGKKIVTIVVDDSAKEQDIQRALSQQNTLAQKWVFPTYAADAHITKRKRQ